MKDFIERRFSHLTRPGIQRNTFLRRSLAISLVILGISLHLASTAQTTEKVVVFTQNISPGTSITTEQITTKELSPALIPKSAVKNADDIIGATAAAFHPEGSVVTTYSTTSAELLHSLVPNITNNLESDPFNLVPIKLSDPTIAQLLRQGDTVTVISTSPNTTEKEVIAAGGTVIYTTRSDDKNSLTSPGTVMLALPTTAAETVAAKSLTSPLTVVVTGNGNR